jgi:hypothetical protein
VKLSGVSGSALATRTVAAFLGGLGRLQNRCERAHRSRGLIVGVGTRLKKPESILCEGFSRAGKVQGDIPGLSITPFRGYRPCRIEYGPNAIATDIADIALRPYIDVAFEAIL